MPDEIIRREFPAELVPSGDGRTLDLRVVPFNTVARVSDDGGRTVYEEMWMPGAFDKQLSAPNRVDVLVNFEHQQGIGGVVARGTELRDTGVALDMTARMLSVSDADKALELVNEGVVGGVSLEAIPLKSERGKDGVVRRVAARLINVALCRSPAYPDAAVLAVREMPPDEIVERVAMPEGMDSMPDGVKACTMNGTAGYSGGKACHMHDGSDSSMRSAMRSAMKDAGMSSAQMDSMMAGRMEPLSPQVVREELAAEELAKNPPEFSDAELALQRVGFEPLLVRAVTHKPWDGSPARFTDEEYQRSCLIDRGGSDMPTKERCSLPVLEPNGDVNANALGAAAAALAGARGGLRMVSPEMKAKAARKLMRYYGQAEMDPPDSLRRLAAS